MRWLIVFLALVWMTGCVGLPARKAGPQDVLLTRDSATSVAGEYVIPLRVSPVEAPAEFAHLLRIGLAGESGDSAVGRLSIAVLDEEIHLTINDQEQSFSARYGFEIIDGEIQLVRQTRWIWRYMVFWGPDFLKVGIVKRTDGSIVMRHMRGAIGVFIILPFGMGYPSNGIEVRFSPAAP